MRITAKATGAMLALALLVPLGGTAQQRGREGKAAPVIENLPEEQKVDTAISEMLAAWQIGNVEMLKEYHAEEVTVVSGAFEPPVLGWAAYAQAYRRQRERMETLVLLERINTVTHVKGNLAWVTYQWIFSATVDGRGVSARGHTTLVLEKRRDRWLITHNHTSAVPEAPPVAAAPPQPVSNR